MQRAWGREPEVRGFTGWCVGCGHGGVGGKHFALRRVGALAEAWQATGLAGPWWPPCGGGLNAGRLRHPGDKARKEHVCETHGCRRPHPARGRPEGRPLSQEGAAGARLRDGGEMMP